jgi:acyl dehydratase
VVAMRAYTDACSERPPGNIHGEQSYEIIRLPEIGTRLVTEVRCAAKEIRGERRWITFTTETRAADSTPLFNGVMKVAWSK